MRRRDIPPPARTLRSSRLTSVRFVHDDGREAVELDLEARAPDVTVADVAEALGRPAGPLVVGRHRVDGDLDLVEAGFHEGVVVQPVEVAEPDAPSAPPAVVVAVAGGLVAGGRAGLAPGTWTIGRAAGSDLVVEHPTVSAAHCRVVVSAAGGVVVDDLGSLNGTWVDDEAVVGPTPVAPSSVVRLGAVLLRLGPPPVDDRSQAVDPLRHVTAAGTIPFNRPPRPAPPPGPPAVAVPAPPREPSSVAPLSIVGVVAPLVLGGVMVAYTGEVVFALFMLLSPVAAVGGWLESRRRARRSRTRGGRAHRTEVERFRAELGVAAAGARRRRWDALPDPAETLRRAEGPSVRLWERRAGHPDFLQLHAGVGEQRWSPPLRQGSGDPSPEVAEVIEAGSSLTGAPVEVDLANGGVVGIVGPRPAALALARSLLCQAATQSGPADLSVAVVCGADRVGDWDWTKWLPHARDAATGGDARLLAGDPESGDALLRALAGRDAEAVGDHVTLAVLDADGVTAGRNAPARAVLRGEGGPAAGIVVAASPHELPALCTTVVELDGADGLATLRRPQRGEVVEGLLAAGVTEATARRCARRLAPYDDPELVVAGAGLPSAVSLATLLGVDPFDPDALLAAWQARGVDPNLDAVLGMGETGPFRIDLVRDGPHGLLGGTTGSGKSELLRTLVASLATTADPDHLTFVLVDYKGGAAFDECARLPHTVGLVTDLDEHLGERALRCLEAELRHRERRLRAAGASDLGEYLHLPAARREPMPRLVVVIDEFATMKAELPDFVESLVGIAQRGRSLGVHLLLATQRPSGAVSEQIKANTNLRIALRVQDAADSADIIGTPEAAAIGRGQAGRAHLRLGPGEVVPIQTALVTGRTAAAAPARVDLAPFRFGPRVRASAAVATGADGPTDLARLVDAARAAFDRSGAAPPRRPWPDPLPGTVPLTELAELAATSGVPGGEVPVALADDPDAQAQYPTGWARRAGNLLLYGVGGSGTTTALAACALALARVCRPDDLHLYVLDLGAGELVPLAGLPHTGAVVTGAEPERRERLLRFLHAELERRRALAGGAAGEPEIVVLVDGFATLRAELDDLTGMDLLDGFTRVVADGPGLGVRTVIAADRVGAVPAPLAATVAQKWVLRLADPHDYGAFSVSGRPLADAGPGRAVVAPDGLVVQVGFPGADLAAAVARLAAAVPAATARPPAGIRSLPDHVALPALAPHVVLGGARWHLPVGVGGDDLAPVGLTLYEGEHALVAGPARAGKSTALVSIAHLARAADPAVGLVAVASARSPLAATGLVDAVVRTGSEVAATVAPGGRWLVLVDDADRLDDPDGSLERLLDAASADLRVVAAGRADTLRGLYGHWTRALRRSRLGVLLQPDLDLDGELLGLRLPRRAPVALGPGRGWVVGEGRATLVQVGCPDEAVDGRARAH